MGLVADKMKPDIQNILGKHNKQPKWDKIIKAWAGPKGYLADAQNAAGQQTTAVNGYTDCGQRLNDLMKKPRKNGSMVASKMAKEIVKCMDTYMSTYQTTIITAPGFVALSASLFTAMGAPTKSKTKAANDIIKALHLFSTPTVIVNGIIPGSPPVPFTGPLA